MVSGGTGGTDLQVGVSLLQQLSEVQGHAPGRGLQLLGVEIAGLQPLEVHHTVLAVGQLGERGEGEPELGPELEPELEPEIE